MNEQPKAPVLTRAHLFAAAFFALFLFLLYQAAHLLTPFLSALLWAAIVTLALFPLERRLLRLTGGREGLAAGIMTLLCALLIIGPAVAVLATLASQAVELFQWTTAVIQSGGLADVWGRFAASPLGALLDLPAAGNIDLHGFIVGNLGEISSKVAAQAGTVLKNTLLLLANLAIMIIALFFFFRDGERHYRETMDLLPFTDSQKDGITRKFMDTFKAVIGGVLLIALLQGSMTAIGFALFGVPFPALWGFLAVFFALLPVGGTALVWIPGAVYLYLTGSVAKAVLLSVWGVVLVSLPDNVLKPLLIGKKAKLPTFFLFIAIIGGIKAFGFLGILFGPVIVTLLLAAVQIYREEFANK